MGPRVPQPVSVSGGSNGVEAHYDEIVALARRFGHAATDSGGAALTLHGYLVDPGLYTSGLFDPAGLANFEADLLDALDGYHGLSWIAAQCAAIDGELRTAAAAYQEADRAATALLDRLGALPRLTPAAVHALAMLLATGNVPHALETLLTDDPALVDALMNAGPVIADAMAAPLWMDGQPLVVGGAVTRTAPPRNLADVMSALALRNHGSPGEIDVRILTGADGTRRVIVDIPGTKTWDPRDRADITGPITNVRALVGLPTAYERGVLQAMQRAGVKPTDDVMLVGHSEGGMIAVEAALSCAKSGQFRVSHIVTAGAPLGLTVAKLPGSVQVLALENHNDIVAHLDGRTNPDKVNVTTATVTRGNGTILDDHGLDEAYVPGAADIDVSHDPSLTAFLSGASGFLQATNAETHTYVITRGN
ncbi:MAG: Mbeg1-like protein [Pseudonocardiales bacterium]